MAYKFEEALKAGTRPESIYKFLESKGRASEAVDWFEEHPEFSTSAIPRKGEKETIAIGAEKLARAAIDIPLFVGGAAAGGSLAGFPGSVAGAGLGSAAAEAIKQGAENIGGARRGFDISEITNAGLSGAGTEALFGVLGPVAKAVSEVSSPLTRIVSMGYQAIKKVLPGITKESIETIRQFPKEVETLAQQSSVPVHPIILKLQNARDQVVTALKSYRDTVKEGLTKAPEFLFGKGGIARNFTIQESKGMQTQAIKSLRENFNVGVQKDGTLVFAREIKPSSIVSPTEQKAVQEAYNLLLSFEKHPSPANAEAILKRIEKLKKYDPQRPASLAIQDIENAMVENLQSLPYFQSLIKARTEYAANKKILKEINSLLVPSKTAEKTGIGTAAPSKIRAIGKEDIAAIKKETIDFLKEKTGIDLTKEMKIINAASEINPNLIPQDIGGIGRGIQKAFNPMIGQIYLEAAKGSPLFNFLNASMRAGKKAGAVTGKIIAPTIKPGTFESIREITEER